MSNDQPVSEFPTNLLIATLWFTICAFCYFSHEVFYDYGHDFFLNATLAYTSGLLSIYQGRMLYRQLRKK